MGTWGTALFSDDLAGDLRSEFRDLIGEGLTAAAAVKRLKTQYASSLLDADEESVFWLALADTGWRLGRLDEEVRDNALRVIESGQDLARWENAADQKKREQVLQKLRTQLQAAPLSPKRIAKTTKSANEWQEGEVIGFRLLSGRWVLLRVIGHHEDRGGKSAVCELLNWVGDSISSVPAVDKLSIRKEAGPRGTSQFLFQEPRSKRDKPRIIRTGIVSKPEQRSSGYSVFVWPFVDRLFREVFGLE
jgi:hypothetical protein